MLSRGSRYTLRIFSSVLNVQNEDILQKQMSIFKNYVKFINVPFLNLRPFQNYVKLYHTSQPHLGLDEFFDDKEHWGEQEVKVGRSWKLQELRLKSNEDLHKLWFVLLKEKNMLLTMEGASKEEYKVFPNPERIDKVNDSMKHIEEAIKERNRAYWLLETGEIGGERPIGPVVDYLGRSTYRKFKEHIVPDYMHLKIINHPFLNNPIPNQFSRLLREQGIKWKKAEKSRMINHIAKLFKRYPDIDMDALQQKYPDYDVAKIRAYKRSRGSHSRNLS